MSAPAIQVRGLGKQYQLGDRERYRTLRDALSQLGRRAAAERAARRDFWAVRDVSFDVRQGEAMGVIGRNGAGKSTLLKLLARITDPTEGRAEIRGRVGSLLEVGTGFHPELTGRENIYLSGAILGMRRAEIARKFDAIVAFAGVERFIDTPVKHYSSGMYLRLAFSVAAHLEHEILLVDEVLAVGDAVFQLKCLNKMSEVSGCGRTILFVSHNLDAVARLCRRSLLLEDGRVAHLGTPQECVDRYLLAMQPQAGQTASPISLIDHPGRTKRHDGPVRLTWLQIVDHDGRPTRIVPCGDMLTVRLGYETVEPVPPQDVSFSLTIVNTSNHRLACCRSHDTLHGPLTVGRSGELVCRIPRLPLIPGLYRLAVACQTEAGFSDGVYDAVTVEVTGGSFYPSGSTPPHAHGDVLLEHHWEAHDFAFS